MNPNYNNNTNSNAIRSMPSSVNDVLLKFIEPKVHTIAHEKNEYIREKEEFKKYMTTMGPKKASSLSSTNNEQQSKYVRTRKRYLCIDSRDRDLTVYPNANSYTVDIGKESFANVGKIELVSCQFINFKQLIRHTPTSEKNNVIQWNVEEDILNGQYVVYSAEIDAGNYTAEELEKEIENKMNAVPRINGEAQYFNVSINTLGDVVSFSTINFRPALNPFNVLTFGINPNLFTVYMPNHGFEVGDKIWVTGSEAIGTGPPLTGQIPQYLINLYHTVNTVIDENAFTFIFIWPGASVDSNVFDAGGEAVQIGTGTNFRLLFALPQSPATVLGFESENTPFDVTQFNVSLTPTTSLNYILPLKNGAQSLIVTVADHGLVTGDRIFIYKSIPPGVALIPTYNHQYFRTALTPLDEQIRDDYVNEITSPNGYYVTVIDNLSFSVPVAYGDYEIQEINPATGDNYLLSDWIEDTLVPSVPIPFAGITVNDALELSFTGEPYMFLSSNVIGGDFRKASQSINDVTNIFSKIYLAGDSNDSIYNSFVGGKKTFYNSVYEYLDKIDLKFQYPNGSLVDFLNTEHSITLKITEVIQKVEGSEFNSKIGLYEYSASKNIITPPTYFVK